MWIGSYGFEWTCAKLDRRADLELGFAEVIGHNVVGLSAECVETSEF